MWPGLGWDWRFQYETIFQLVKGKGIKNNDPNAVNVLRAKKLIPMEGEHPTPKSTEIIYEILKRKTKEGDLVLDPFNGGGATSFTCKTHQRRFIGIEISPKYCEIANKRLAQEVLPF
jgi:DNA modification methylase